MTPRAIVIRTAGTNCDAELCRAFERAGATPDLVHVDRLIADPRALERADLVGFPGGFSYGDDVASGRLLAVRVRERLYPALRDAARRGVPMIGVCNGFQVLVQVGLLPGPEAGEAWPEQMAPVQSLSLTQNAGGRFVDAWHQVRFEPNTTCVWTEGLDSVADVAMCLPSAHAEGRLVADSLSTIQRLEQAGQIAVRYMDNFNGSIGAIAGVCDTSGRIFGLMPHPERYLDWTRHPSWTRLDASIRDAETPGLMMFRNAVGAAVHARA